MKNPKYKTTGKYTGLKLWYNCTNGHQYQMKIWRNFRGISYFHFDENDKKVSHEACQYSV